MTIDVHTHYYPRPYMQLVKKLAEDTSPGAEGARMTMNNAQMQDDPVMTGAMDERLRLMDKAGIDTQILSFSSPNIWYLDANTRANIVRTYNDSVAETIQSYPGRFLLFANVPLPFVDKAIEEVAYAYDTLGAVGVCTCTHIADKPIDDPQFEPFYAAVNARKGIIFFHPDGFPARNLVDNYGMAWGIGVLFDDTIVLVRLIYSGLMERYPDITWIVPHLGGTTPFVAKRLDFLWEMDPSTHKQLAQAPSTYLHHPNLYIDSINPQQSALALAHAVFGVDHLVFGSDFPYASRKDLSFGVTQVHSLGLQASETEQILSGNITTRLHATAK